MKLFRFELKAEPGTPRSGIVFNGIIHETVGGEGVARHQPQDVRPLAPVPQPPSLRFFPARAALDEDPTFYYGNPGAIVGASTMLDIPEGVVNLGFEPYLAAVLVTGGRNYDPDEADDTILGYSIMIALVDRSADRKGTYPGAARDLGLALGPVMTTPDELDDFLVSQEFGRAHRLSVSARVNGVERGRGNVEDLPFTPSQAISAASRTCNLREGDVFALGPLVDLPDVHLEGGDEVNVAIENLGALSLKLSLDA